MEKFDWSGIGISSSRIAHAGSWEGGFGNDTVPGVAAGPWNHELLGILPSPKAVRPIP